MYFQHELTQVGVRAILWTCDIQAIIPTVSTIPRSNINIFIRKFNLNVSQLVIQGYIATTHNQAQDNGRRWDETHVWYQNCIATNKDNP